MPKIKPHSGAQKRFRVTGSGKLRYKKANKGHLMAHKNSRRVRRLNKPGLVSAPDERRMTRLLGI